MKINFRTVELNQNNINHFQDHLKELKRSFFYLDNLNNKVNILIVTFMRII
jgi:hypothetical protein